ncbi:MAG: hypothetical protein KC635_21205 [Myxococcales bacterium]|nr:hypothetical protein [Myxococcales bacterium]MCB9734361.1 hypothetical protein [Deltaproteobacteria bacterium]
MQQKITKLLNNILGVGMNRRSTSHNLPVSDKRIWEVRSKHHRPVKGRAA